MEISLSKFEVKSGKNKGKVFDMVEFKKENSKRPLRLSLSKCKLVLDHKEEIDFVVKQGGL